MFYVKPFVARNNKILTHQADGQNRTAIDGLRNHCFTIKLHRHKWYLQKNYYSFNHNKDIKEKNQENKRVKGIEPSSQPWEGCILPLYYTRKPYFFPKSLFKGNLPKKDFRKFSQKFPLSLFSFPTVDV